MRIENVVDVEALIEVRVDNVDKQSMNVQRDILVELIMDEMDEQNIDLDENFMADETKLQMTLSLMKY